MRRLPLYHSHGFKNNGNDVVVTQGGIDHQMIERAGRPVGMEIMFDKKHAFAVDGVNQIFCILEASALILDAAELFRAGRVKKNMKRVATFPQENKALRARQ